MMGARKTMKTPTRKARGLARALGWFSIALGATQLVAPRTLASAAGLPRRAAVMRACGAREVAAGIGLLRARQPAPWIWARLAGDAVDLALIATAMPTRGRARSRAWVALGTVAAITAVDVVCARRLARGPSVPLVDYSDRSGFPRPVEEMRGAASDFRAPRDMRIPAPLRPLAPRVTAIEGGATHAHAPA
jgi:hypothetical protein